jgi:hypothetical protein
MFRRAGRARSSFLWSGGIIILHFSNKKVTFLTIHFIVIIHLDLDLD